MAGSDSVQSRKALEFVARCSDAKKLKQLAENARLSGEAEVERASLLRLYAVSPEAAPGTLEHDVWQSIHALEGALSSEREKTTRLGRTRQKIKRDGERKTVADLVLGEPSEGFQMLLERRMSHLTFEAVALRHPDSFGEDVLKAARQRLRGVEGASGVATTC